MVDVQLHRSIAEFGVIADRLFHRDPVMFTAELTALKTASPSADNILLSVWVGTQLRGALVRTPPLALLTSGLPTLVAPDVAKVLAQAGYDIPSIQGLTANAVAFADTWREVTGAHTTIELEERLYRLGNFLAPPDVIGQARLANRSDADLLTGWFDQFHGEAFGFVSDLDARLSSLTHMLESGSQVLLWTLDDTPVSMARLHPHVAAMSRIGPVFTPPTLRGQGYGSAVTAAAAQHALLTGAKHVVLFADLAKPVSNSIYQRIGFEPVARTVEIAVNRCQGSGRPRDRASARRHPRDKN